MPKEYNRDCKIKDANRKLTSCACLSVSLIYHSFEGFFKTNAQNVLQDVVHVDLD